MKTVKSAKGLIKCRPIRVVIIKKAKNIHWWYHNDNFLYRVFDVYYDKADGFYRLFESPLNASLFSGIRNYHDFYILKDDAKVLASKNRSFLHCLNERR